jgi:hypothetical protein
MTLIAFTVKFCAFVYFKGVIFENMYCHTEGAAVAQLVEALRYKPAGRGLDSRWCQWIFSLA